MSYVHGPHVEQLSSARERVAKMRAGSKAHYDRVEKDADRAIAAGREQLAFSCGAQMIQFQDRIWMCDLADILLDAMKHGADMPIIRDIPGKSQMQEQSPPGDAPTGLPPERTRRPTTGTLSMAAAYEWERFDSTARRNIRDQGLWVDLDGNWHTASGGICMRPNPDGSLGN
jgi:hypothetical protein